MAAGCGGGAGPERDTAPRIPAPLASELAAASDDVAARLEAGDGCGARERADALHARVVAAVNTGRVPARYQEELGAATAALAARIECVPPRVDEDEEGHGHGKGRAKGRGKGKGRKEEDD